MTLREHGSFFSPDVITPQNPTNTRRPKPWHPFPLPARRGHTLLLVVLAISSGTSHAQTSGVQHTIYADHFPGHDILEQVSAAFQSCDWQCNVVVSPLEGTKTYVAASSLSVPLWNTHAPTLTMTGACIQYKGAGYAIDTYEVQPNPAAAGLRIVDGCLIGNPSAKGGIRLLPTSDVSIAGTRITDFINGDAVAVYGTENVTISGNYSFSNNRYGVRLQGTFCRQGLPLQRGEPDFSCTDRFDTTGCDGTTFVPHDGICGYAGNMLHVHDGVLSNRTWDIYEQGAPGLQHLSNSYVNNEINGGGGGIFLEISRGDRIESNYFEAKTGNYLVLGNASVSPAFYVASGVAVTSNYFTTNGHAAIQVENADHLSITDDTELKGTLSTCFLDSVNIGSTVYSNNKLASTNALCRRGYPNARATDAAIAHFSGDAADGRVLRFVLREDDDGTIFVGGPAQAPSGACTAEGQWVPSRDGHLSICQKGTWTRKL